MYTHSSVIHIQLISKLLNAVLFHSFTSYFSMLYDYYISCMTYHVVIMLLCYCILCNSGYL